MELFEKKSFVSIYAMFPFKKMMGNFIDYSPERLLTSLWIVIIDTQTLSKRKDEELRKKNSFAELQSLCFMQVFFLEKMISKFWLMSKLYK